MAILLNEFYGDMRLKPSAGDAAIAHKARALAAQIIRGEPEVEVHSGGHATVTGRMASPAEIRRAPAAQGMRFEEHRYGAGDSVLYGVEEAPDGSSIHVHRSLNGNDEDDRISVYLGTGAGRSAARAAMQAAGFKDFI
jgi:hypothetical protein